MDLFLRHPELLALVLLAFLVLLGYSRVAGR